MAIIAVRRIGKRRKRRDWTRIARAVRRHMNTVERRKLLAEFKSVVLNWDHKPKFIAKMGDKGGDFVLSVRPAGREAQKWRWVSRGTKGPYKIRAKNVPTLAFKTNYKPKTKPGYVFGGPGIATGPWRNPVEVEHPGIEPRLFEEHIAERFGPQYRRRINNLIRREIRKSQ
jgi:hypothetical protein